MLIDFKDIGYLRKGSKRQKKACIVLEDLKIFDNLRSYRPVLTGSVPLDIATDESDLDITCEFQDPDGFAQALIRYYSHIRDFDIKEKSIRGVDTVVCSFSHAKELKGKGVKTEPAFAGYFRIEGDPYARLYDLSLVTEKRLREIAGARSADI